MGQCKSHNCNGLQVNTQKLNNNVSQLHGCPIRTIILYVQWTVKITGNMLTKFQVDWTSTSSKTTSTKNFNLKQDRRTDGRTNRRTKERTKNGQTNRRTHRPENIMPINEA